MKLQANWLEPAFVYLLMTQLQLNNEDLQMYNI